MNGKVPRHIPFQFLSVSATIVVLRRIILTCDKELNTKSLQAAVIHACAGLQVIPRGPLEGDHMANGHVEMRCTRSDPTVQNT